MTYTKTRGIEIIVANWFRGDLSNESNANYFFNYEIIIRNRLSVPVQLLTREWHIVHLLHGVSTVSGEGVVGEKPVLSPGEEFKYVSGCELINSMGMMYGKFFFKDLDIDEIIYAEIPTFNLVYPVLLN